MFKFLLSILRAGLSDEKCPHEKGKHLEQLTYRSLRHLERHGSKFLLNTRIPRTNGETTEIDVLLICSKGIIVFECKNYDGWIFGDEVQHKWTQTLPKGRGRCHKEYFYNPIMQNSTHIKYLKQFVGKNVPMWSVIVFSDNCVFKNVTVRSQVNVIQHYEVATVVAGIFSHADDIYTESEINAIYNNIALLETNAA